MSYGELIKRKAHPVLQRTNRKHQPDPLLNEIVVARAHGLIADVTNTIPPEQNWFMLPRITRAVLVAAYGLERTERAILDYDDAERQRAENKRKAPPQRTAPRPPRRRR